MMDRERNVQEESTATRYRRSRGHWHRLFPLISLLIIDVIFLVMLDEIFENSKDAIIRSDKNYRERFFPPFGRIYTDFSTEVPLPKRSETEEEYQQRCVEYFETNADRFLNDTDFVYKISLIGVDGSVVAEWENAGKLWRVNSWRNCFLSRDFSRTQTINRNLPPNDSEAPADMIAIRVHYTSPRGWPEIRALVVRFWVYALAFVIITAAFYFWLDRKMIRPLAGVAGRLEQLAAKGSARLIRQPRVDIEAAYNRLAESQRGVRLEMELDRLIDEYQRSEEPLTDEMSVQLLRDTARPIVELFSLRAAIVHSSKPDGEGWEVLSAWPESFVSKSLAVKDRIPVGPEHHVENTGGSRWTVPISPEDETVAIFDLYEGDDPLAQETVSRIQRLVENSLVRCAGFTRRLAEERNRFGINLAINMGHDLTNIIATGKWDLNTIHRALSMGVVQIDPNRGLVFNKAVDGLKNNLQFLQEMVDIYRALGAARKPQYERGDISHYLREVCDLFCLSTSQRLDLHTDFSEDCEAVVEPRLLKMAVFNLLANAANAIQRRKDGLVGGKIAVQLRQNEDDVVIRVQDDGPGIRDVNGRLMDQREINRIFGSGYTTKDAATGGGLGLVWVKSIVEEFHRGSIVARNVADGGAEITIRFPRETAGS